MIIMTKIEIKARIVCCFEDCNEDIGEWGHNAQPLMEGRCCETCNYTRVIPTRLANIVFPGSDQTGS